MKYHVLFLVILLIALVSGVNATIINTTILLATNYGDELHLGNAQTSSGSYSYSAPSGNMVIFSTITPRTEGQTLNWNILRAGSNTISGSLKIVSTGILSGNTVASITGGSTSTSSYAKALVLPYNPSMTIFFVKSNTAFYLVVADNNRFVYSVSGDPFHPIYAPFLLDTTADCYIQLSDNPTTYPVTQIQVMPLSSGSYDILPYYESVTAAKVAEQYTADVQASVTSGDTLSFARSLINKILGAIDLLNGLAKTIGSFFNILTIFMAFIFAGEIFVGMNVLYIAFALLLSIAESDDLFKAFGKFQRFMMKLFRFYMELFRAMKDILKWW